MWPFKRKPKKSPHRGPKTVDWKPGDMAECIASGGSWDNETADDPIAGDKFMVAAVSYDECDHQPFRAFFLKFVGISGKAYEASAFRKITLTDTGADRKVSKRKPVTVQS